MVWRQTYYLLLIFFLVVLVACGETEGAPEPIISAVSSSTPSPEPSSTPEPTATATQSPTGTAESTIPPELTATNMPPTNTPEPSATALPEPTATEIPEEESTWYEEMDLQPIMEPVSQEWMTQEIQDTKYNNNWPLPRDNGEINLGDRSLIALQTNHEWVDLIDIGDGLHFMEARSDLVYRDANDQVRIVKVPIKMVNPTEGTSYRFPVDGAADTFIIKSKEEFETFASYFYYLNGKAKQAYVEVRFQLYSETGEDTTDYGNGYIYIEDNDYMPKVQRALGITQEDIDNFAATGDPKYLPVIDGYPTLIPGVIYSYDFMD